MNNDPAAFAILVALVIIGYHQIRDKIPGFRERYYASPTWRRRSRWCRRRNWGRCKTIDCRQAAHVAHHKNYRFFASWTPIEVFDLIPLCRSCHNGLHAVAKGRLTQAKRKNPYTKYDDVLTSTTEDWISGRIDRKRIAT